MDLGLAGKRVLVTGATRGIGRAVVEAFLAEGAEVAFCARDGRAVADAVAELEGTGRVVGRAVDVGRPEALREFVATAVGELGGLDVYVHNTSAKPAKTLAAWQANFEVDLMALVHGVEAAADALAAGRGGSLVAVGTSAVAEHFGPGANSYSALKAAMTNWTLGQAQVLGARGIRCNVVSPGPIWVDGGDWDRIRQRMPELFDATVAAHPAGVMGGVGDVANAVAFLASDAARHVNGANLTVDGGFTKRVDY